MYLCFMLLLVCVSPILFSFPILARLYECTETAIALPLIFASAASASVLAQTFISLSFLYDGQGADS